MPCATGKSLTAFWIAQALDAKLIVVAVPSLALIRQSLLDWTREYLAHGEVPQWLVVCSDESTGKLERDEFVGDTYDLGIATTTKPEDIVPFLRKRTGRRIVFTTYQSSGRLAAAARGAGIKFDLAILDEAHKTVGVKGKAFATLLSDESIAVRWRLFMTATERVLRGENDDVFSMDDEAVYGKRFHQLTFKDAIAQGIISDYKILTITVSDAAIRDLIAENRLIDVKGDETDAQGLAAAVALRRTFERHGVTHAISFHRSIKAASTFSDRQAALDDALQSELTSLHVSSKKSAGERAELMRQFVGEERALMTNARCLTEGVDVPAIDCVLFADPKQSVVDIVQAAGRALRPYPGKEYGYILLPLVVPNGVDVDTFAESTAFKHVARTITALSTQDERIAEQFRIVEYGRQAAGKIVEIEGDVPVGTKLTLGTFAAQIGTKIWERAGRANWRPFREARDFVRTLGLRSTTEWQEFVKSAKRPSDIPTNPNTVYRNSGWVSSGDWLGTGRLATRFRPYRSFPEARAYVRSFGFRSSSDWQAYRKSDSKPIDIPSNPNVTYAKDGWAGIGDWLGTGTVAPQERAFRPFGEARAFVRRLGLRSWAEWQSYCKSTKKPIDIPTTPGRVYREQGWFGYGDWLGSGTIATQLRTYLPFKEARTIVQLLKLRSAGDWKAHCSSGKKPPGIPNAPEVVYRDSGWSGVGDWLGTGVLAKSRRIYRPFNEARAFIRGLGFRSSEEWHAYRKRGDRPSDIPSNPNVTYAKEGWAGMGDWLGTGTIAARLRVYRPFQEARAFVHSHGPRSQLDWVAYCRSGKKPVDIPSDPGRVYREQGWAGYGDWLGTGRVASHMRTYRGFEDARAFVRKLGLRSKADWAEYAKSGDRPVDIPSTPARVYGEQGWVGFGDWLGSGTVKTNLRAYRPFPAARAFVRRLAMRSANAWRTYSKSGDLPVDMPASPNMVYKDNGWTSWPDWLGTDAKPKSKRMTGNR